MSTVFVGAPSLQSPVSQVCTAAQFASDDFTRLMDLIKQQPRLHRKQWEYAYVLRVLELTDMLRAGRTALGFGCGNEPISAVLASAGVRVTATEHPGFRPGGEDRVVSSVMDLFYGGICSEDVFRAQVSHRPVDMLQLPGDLGQFDTVWACSAIEELGSIQAGSDFVLAATKLLRPGGVGIFTTQFNLRSDTETLELPTLSAWRRLDLLNLQSRLIDAGCEMLPLSLTGGKLPEDAIIDTPPYGNPVHLKLMVEDHAITSIGFALRKP